VKRDLNKENSQQILDVATVLEWFFYDFGTGGLYWRKRPGARVHQNDEAGTDYSGSRRVLFRGKSYYTYDLIHMIHHSLISEGLYIELINRILADPIIQCLNQEEMGDAEIFVRESKGKLCYGFVSESWMVCKHNQWIKCNMSKVLFYVDKVIDVYWSKYEEVKDLYLWFLTYSEKISNFNDETYAEIISRREKLKKSEEIFKDVLKRLKYRIKHLNVLSRKRRVLLIVKHRLYNLML
jgi:hypothetical protein